MHELSLVLVELPLGCAVLRIFRGRGIGWPMMLLLSQGACAARIAATGPKSMGQPQAACKSAAAKSARMAPSALGSWMCPSGLGSALRTPAREDRLPDRSAKPGARRCGQWCHRCPHGQHHFAEEGGRPTTWTLDRLKGCLVVEQAFSTIFSSTTSGSRKSKQEL